MSGGILCLERSGRKDDRVRATEWRVVLARQALPATQTAGPAAEVGPSPVSLGAKRLRSDR